MSQTRMISFSLRRYQHMVQRIGMRIDRQSVSSSSSYRCLTSYARTPRMAASTSSSSSSPSSAPKRFTPASAALASSSAPSSALPAHITQTACGLYVDRSLPRNFSKILIANRGEIACRIIRTCRELGVRTVAVYSDVDARARHVMMADEAYRIGDAAASTSYLLVDKLLEIAAMSGAQAIHPGYGFLSENAKFAKQCEDAGVEFIGPPASAIAAMGSKSASKIIMTDAGVPVVPGYHGEDQSLARLESEALKCGYPIMLKAVLGGGGKGMRIVLGPDEFQENLEACKREALKSFGDERVLLEKYIQRPRHIEFQVFADKLGNAVYLYERDCSVQRRHQKVLEEAPAPGMTNELRAEMGRSAVNAAKAVGYVGAGTVEFIFDAASGEYFFMEMNTRLQVEHPVTEMVVRRDLVQLQLHVAAGHPLPLEQAQVQAHGHAIEARVYAENPHNNFLPATGRLIHLSPPANTPNVRVESGVREGDEVSIYYDPMISKLCVWGSDRSSALDLLAENLRTYQIVGPPTNIPFLLRSVTHPLFARGQVETGFIADNMPELLPLTSVGGGAVDLVSASFALLYLIHAERAALALASASASVPETPWFSASSSRVNSANPRVAKLLRENVLSNDGQTEEVAFEVQVADQGNMTGLASDAFSFTFPGAESVAVSGGPKHASCLKELYATVGPRAFHATVVRSGRELHVFVCGRQVKYRLPQANFATSDISQSGCTAPMAGKVVKVNVHVGDKVIKGQPLVIMEAMKMEHVIRAPSSGTVASVIFAVGDFVEGGKTVVTFEALPKDDKKSSKAAGEKKK